VCGLFCTGQKYLLRELQKQLPQVTTVSQQLQNQLASFDRRTRNYSFTFSTEFLPSTQNSAAASARVAASHFSPDILIELNPPSSIGSNGGNQHVPVAEARELEENTRPAGAVSPLSPGRQSAGGTSRSASIPIYYSDDESQASASHSPGEDHTPRYLSDIDDEEFDADEMDDRNAADFDEDDTGEYSDDESLVDGEYRSHGYDEYDDSDDSRSHHSPRENYSFSDNDSCDSRPLHHSPQHLCSPGGEACARTNMQRRTLDCRLQMPSLTDEDGEENDDRNGAQQSRQQTDTTAGSSRGLQDEREPRGAAEGVERPEYAVVDEIAELSEEQERITVRLRLNSQRSDGAGFHDEVEADAVHTSHTDDDALGDSAAGVSGVNRSSSLVDSDDDNDDLSGDEADGMHHSDISDALLSDHSNSERSDFDYDLSLRHYRSRNTSTSASLPASPSLHDNNGNVDQDKEEVFSHSDDDGDDGNGRHQSSDEWSADEDAHTSSPRRSRSHTKQERHSQPASPVLSTGSSPEYERNRPVSSHAREHSSRSSSRHSWTGSGSRGRYSSADSEAESDDSWALAGRRGTKRRHSARSATGDEDDDDDDVPDADGDRPRHKLHRFR